MNNGYNGVNSLNSLPLNRQYGQPIQPQNQSQPQTTVNIYPTPPYQQTSYKTQQLPPRFPPVVVQNLSPMPQVVPVKLTTQPVPKPVFQQTVLPTVHHVQPIPTYNPPQLNNSNLSFGFLCSHQ